MYRESIVYSIKLLCQKNDITITKLEETLNMSQGLISRWTKTEPSLGKIIDIASYFKVSLDEIIRYNVLPDEKFINKLIRQTELGKLKWFNYKAENSNPKKFTNKYAKDWYEGTKGRGYNRLFSGTETSFYVPIEDGYISIYSYHEYHNVKKVASIILFIQADDNSELIDQKYSIELLLPLWTKILYSLKKEAPDDIKAEELKKRFLLEDN